MELFFVQIHLARGHHPQVNNHEQIVTVFLGSSAITKFGEFCPQNLLGWRQKIIEMSWKCTSGTAMWPCGFSISTLMYSNYCLWWSMMYYVPICTTYDATYCTFHWHFSTVDYSTSTRPGFGSRVLFHLCHGLIWGHLTLPDTGMCPPNKRLVGWGNPPIPGHGGSSSQATKRVLRCAKMCQVSPQRGKDVHSVRPGPRQTCWGRCYHHASDWFGSSWCFPCSTSQSTCKKMDKKNVLVPRINVQLSNIKVMWLSGPNSSGKQLTVSTDDMEMCEFLPWNHVQGISLHLRAIWGSPSKPTS